MQLIIALMMSTQPYYSSAIVIPREITHIFTQKIKVLDFTLD